MMAHKLTPVQQRTLNKMTPGRWYSSYELQESLNTLMALERKNLVISHRGLGSMFSPQTSIKWRKVA